MLTARTRDEKYKAIETRRKVRVENLRKLADAMGSWAELGKRLGLSSSFLVALAGPNPRRTVGEVLARDMERCLKVQDGWLDRAH